MKAPWYETSPGATVALLATKCFEQAELYTFVLPAGGPVLRYTTADIDVTVQGDTWSAHSVLVDRPGDRATAHWKVGLDVDTWPLVVMPRAADPVTGAAYPDLIGTVPWLQAVRAGALDGAEVQVDRAFFAAWPRAGQKAVPTGVVTIFYGRVAEADVGRTQVSLLVNSHVELLGLPAPRNLFQASCAHTLFDQGCGLNAASYAVQGAALAGSSGNRLLSDIAAPAGSGTYALGRLTFTSGRNAGLSRAVRAWTPGTFTLLAPFPFPVAPGDAFTAWPGCDKTLVPTLTTTVPLAAPYQVTVAGWTADGGVTYASGEAMGVVPSGPVQGQYAVSEGLYTFAEADGGEAVVIDYAGTPHGCAAFANQPNFGGQPWIPAPETAI